MINDCGIYEIKNMLNNDCYIGQSVNITKRWNGHKQAIQNNVHDNVHLQRAFHKYNSTNFRFAVLLYCELYELTYYEQACVNIFKSVYNMCKICVKSRKGLKVSEETRRKLSLAKLGNTNTKGHKYSKEHNYKISQYLIGNQYTKGRILSIEQKQKLSASLKGRQQSKEHTYNATIARIGGKRSEETKRRMSEAAKKRERYPLSKEHKQKLSIALIGNTRFVGHIPWNKNKKMPQYIVDKITNTKANHKLQQLEGIT